MGLYGYHFICPVCDNRPCTCPDKQPNAVPASNPRTSGPVAVVPLLPRKPIDPINTKTVTVDTERLRAWLEELTAMRLEGGLINAVVTVDGYLEVTFQKEGE